MVAMMTFSVLLPQDNVGVSIITTLKLEEQEQTENQAALQLVKPFEISNNFKDFVTFPVHLLMDLLLVYLLDVQIKIFNAKCR